MLIVLDDCVQFIEAQQHAAFAIFGEATTECRAVAAGGRVPAVDVRLREDVRCGVGWGGAGGDAVTVLAPMRIP